MTAQCTRFANCPLACRRQHACHRHENASRCADLATDTHGTGIADQVELSFIDGSWYVDLRKRTPQPGDPVPASTTRTD
jgi:hypothetical protein